MGGSSAIFLQFKICPRCSRKAPLESQFCAKCRRPFRTPFKDSSPGTFAPLRAATVSALPALPSVLAPRASRTHTGSLTNFYQISKPLLLPKSLKALTAGCLAVLAAAFCYSHYGANRQKRDSATAQPVQFLVDREKGVYWLPGSHTSASKAKNNHAILMSLDEMQKTGFHRASSR